MKIVVTSTSILKEPCAEAKALLDSYADEVVYSRVRRTFKGDELVDFVGDADGYLAGVDYIDADAVRRFSPNLKVISRFGVGIDRVDVPACTERGIVVCNTPGANSTAVCEMAFGLMLAAAKNIPGLDRAVHAGEWPKYTSVELAGKTLGIVGMGAIGKRLAVRALAFEMKVMAYDPFFDESFAKAHGIERADLDTVIEKSDVISLHVPLTEQTRNMIDADSIRRMKDGAIIINTARGGLIDEEAACEALKEGKLCGVGIDAFEEEPLVHSPFKGVPGAILTPHTAALTYETIGRMGLIAAQNLVAVLSGKECGNKVNFR